MLLKKLWNTGLDLAFSVKGVKRWVDMTWAVTFTSWVTDGAELSLLSASPNRFLHSTLSLHSSPTFPVFKQMYRVRICPALVHALSFFLLIARSVTTVALAVKKPVPHRVLSHPLAQGRIKALGPIRWKRVMDSERIWPRRFYLPPRQEGGLQQTECASCGGLP